MSSEPADQPEMNCQWCSGMIPENASACTTCGAARPRADLVAPGFVEKPEPSDPLLTPDSGSTDVTDDENRARQILKDLDAYVPESRAPTRQSRDSSDDVILVVGALVISGISGALLGWFVAPPLIHEIFNEAIGVDTDGPESFRRLGAFIGSLMAMLFGSLLVTVLRR